MHRMREVESLGRWKTSSPSPSAALPEGGMLSDGWQRMHPVSTGNATLPWQAPQYSPWLMAAIVISAPRYGNTVGWQLSHASHSTCVECGKAASNIGFGPLMRKSNPNPLMSRRGIPPGRFRWGSMMPSSRAATQSMFPTASLGSSATALS